MFFQKRDRSAAIEGNDRPAPTKALPRVWDMLVNHFFKLLWANILCVICCIPIVTIPASVCGLYAVVQQYYRKGYGDVSWTFFKEFKQNFLIRLGLSAALVLFPVVGWFLGSVIPADWASYAVCAAFAVFSIITLSWFYPQLALLKIKPMDALKNAMILTGLESGKNFAMIVLWVIFGGAMLIMWPLSAILLLFLIPIAPVIIMNTITSSVIETRIIGKVEEQQELE